MRWRGSAPPHGLQVVATTGAHREPHYGAGHWLLEQTEEQLADRFSRDVLEGLPVGDGPGPRGRGRRPRPASRCAPRWSRPASATGRITPFEHRVLAAVAATWQRTGAAVMVHLEHGSAAFELLAELDRLGVPASAVALAHVDRNPDPGLHAELAAAGAYLGYDGFARSQRWPDSVLLDCLERSAERGAAERHPDRR